jgi:hypothetical protein
MIADLRKDAHEPYLEYKPESDPRQLELDRIVQQAGHLAAMPRVHQDGERRWGTLMGLGLASLVLIGLFLFRNRSSKRSSEGRALRAMHTRTEPGNE